MVIDTFDSLIRLYDAALKDFVAAGSALKRSYPDSITLEEFSDVLTDYSAAASSLNSSTKGTDSYKNALLGLKNTVLLLQALSQETTSAMRVYVKTIQSWLANPPQLQMPNKKAYNAYLQQAEQLRTMMVTLSAKTSAAVVSLA